MRLQVKTKRQMPGQPSPLRDEVEHASTVPTQPAGGIGRRHWLALMSGAGLLGALPAAVAASDQRPARSVPILVYHRFALQRLDSMTVRVPNFEAHLQALRDARCQPVPAVDVVAAFTGGPPLPPRAIVLTADDGHRSQFEVMAPRLARLGWPATLFVYPSAISNAPYAMTWNQLHVLARQPGVTIQSHTYWHPNLLRERERLAPHVFERFAIDQLANSKQRLSQEFGRTVCLLAWPFGLTDAGLMALAERVGYRAAFTLGNRDALPRDPLMALPRHLITDDMSARRLAALVERSFGMSG